ncbi:cysteine-rich receptor-like protein kinase 6 [Aegilops tauschii subsp. strangulata]|nr:cysteine-rich receptor-like protein kinase 6 [Aegilops tauschii subsp. strangulata]
MEESGSHRHIVLVTLALVVVLLAPCAAAYPLLACGSTGEFTANSTYQANLGILAAALPKNASSSPDLFATGAVGAVPDQVSALALCRGDANATACSGCLAAAFHDAQNMCAYAKDAAIYYDPCVLYYSNTPFLSSVDNVRSRTQMNGQNVTSDPGRFNRQVAALVDATADYAAYNSTRRYASGEADLDVDSEFPRVYSWAQCTPDLTPAQCRGCLAGIIKGMPRSADRVGAKFLGVRCSYRYEIYTILRGPVMVRLAAPAPEPAVGPTVPTPATLARRGKWGNKTVVVLAITLPLVVAILAITAVCLCYSRKGRTRRASSEQPPYSANSEDIVNIDSLIADLSTLRRATDNFAAANKLGEGGFGAVYKGNLPDGREIAVKRLSRSSAQGIGELKNELILVAKLQHKNLVRLVGVCVQEHEKLLAYEYMPNKSVDTILFDPERSKELDWGKRLKVISGIARGLQYLHEDSQLRIIHRDLKASNVLLDSDYTPKISDFGLARLFGVDQTREVTNRVVGTYGYMAPEYAVRGQLSVKSDVFSFGVLMLEVVTGRRSSCSWNFDESVNLLSLVWEHWTMGTTAEIIDSSLRGHAPGNQVVKLFHIGLLCVQDNPADRPTMSTVNFMLSSNTVSLRSPSKPSFLMCMSPTSSESTRMPGMASPNEASITGLEPR